MRFEWEISASAGTITITWQDNLDWINQKTMFKVDHVGDP